MKVYVLYAHSTESYHYVMSVFSSYSAMLVWLDQIHNYKSEIDSSGYFKEQLNIDEMMFSLFICLKNPQYKLRLILLLNH